MRSMDRYVGQRAMLMAIEGKSFFCLAAGIQEVYRSVAWNWDVA